MATVTIDSGELPTAKGKQGHELHRVLQCWQGVAAGSFRDDCQALLQMIDEVDELRLWEYAAEGFYKTRDEFIEKVVLIDFDLTEQSLNEIVARLRKGESCKLTLLAAHNQELDAAAPDLKAAHRPKKHYATKNGVMVARLGNSDQYAIAKLRRDRPDIHLRVLNGELTANAGMIEAGFRKKRASRKLAILQRLLKLWAKATADDRDAFREEIEKL